jgi:hypothetical protein
MRKPPPLEVSAEEARKILDGTITEKNWRSLVKETAQHNGWEVLLEIPDRAYQVLAEAAQRDKSLIPTMIALRAWPDLLLGHPVGNNHIYVELKTVKGQPTEEQRVKHAKMVKCGMPVEIWRPGDARVRAVLEEGEW